jgi:gentisate 1,2-dioxygenase
VRDLIYTPPWAWHRHYNDSDTEVQMLLIEYSGILDHLELNRRERGGLVSFAEHNRGRD